jgi:hypothetical protein
MGITPVRAKSIDCVSREVVFIEGDLIGAEKIYKKMGDFNHSLPHNMTTSIYKALKIV